MKIHFPTRQPVMRSVAAGRRLAADPTSLRTGARTLSVGARESSAFEAFAHEQVELSTGAAQADAPTLFASIAGIDPSPRSMSAEEIESLGDFFSQNFLLKGKMPLTLRALLDEIEALPVDSALPDQKLFLVAEGGRHTFSHPDFPLNGRLVFSWAKQFSLADMFLSTVPALDAPDSLMQLIAWSDKDNSFHFFERLSGFWFWAGNSFHALDSRSRGKGPFDSHINGALVMKELEEPWSHWHSMSSSIPRELLADTDFGRHPGLNSIKGGELLESIVKAGIRRWTRGRTERDSASGILERPQDYFRQFVESTSANLVSSRQVYHQETKGEIDLPKSFFLDTGGLVAVLSLLAPDARIVPEQSIVVSGIHYVGAIEALDIGIQAEEGGIRILGDTHFCFLVPERAFEDTEVLKQCVERKWLSARLALCLLLVDFSNPVCSLRRAHLLRHCPTGPLKVQDALFDEPFLASLKAAAGSGSPEEELLSYWHDSDLLGRVKTELNTYIATVAGAARTSEGVHSLVTLAESRRAMFRLRKLHEFSATTAASSRDVGRWIMTKHGQVCAETPLS